MKILITGSGGREHAILRALLRNPRVEKVYCAPGNGGTRREPRCENIPLVDPAALADFAAAAGVSLAIPGSEDLLVAGIADELQKRGIAVLGPGATAARLEGSKCFAKEFMRAHGIRTASYRNFTDYREALDWLGRCPYPTVLKADGLAAGKGVLICADRAEAEAGLKELMLDRRFGEAGSRIVVEEYLQGVEASILAFFDGKTIRPLLSAKDHKRIGEGETGPNTGGMGAVVPNPHVGAETEEEFHRSILLPTLEGLQKEKLLFTGVIFFGLMITPKGVFLLEYNLRMGDPETQAVLALLETDFLELTEACIAGELEGFPIRWREGAACCLVLASGGYPASYPKGIPIRGVDPADSSVYLAGARLEEDELLTAGGRVLNVIGTGATLSEARQEAYERAEGIDFAGKTYRKDIGKMPEENPPG